MAETRVFDRVGRRLMEGLLVVGGLALAWLMASQGLAGALGDARPDLAIEIAPRFADANVALATKALAAGDAGRAAAFARSAIGADPMNEPAVATLGLALDRQGRGDLADAAMTTSAAMSWRDPAAQAWLVKRRLEQGRVGEAFARADALLRITDNDKVRTRMFALFNAATGIESARSALVARLALSPTWRVPFLQQLPAGSGDEARAYAVLTALRAGPAPPQPEEIAPYVNRLTQAGAFQQAAAAWASLSPASSNPTRWPHDGRFLGTSDGTAFTWTTPQGAGATAGVEAAPGAPGRAMRVEYDGNSLPDLPGQLLALPAGRYRLDWRQMTEAGDGALLGWTVVCVDDGRILGRTSGAPAGGGWSEAGLAFETPAAGCTGQWLRLAATPGERRRTTVVWYQDFRGRTAP
jgi:hypothetical protein